MKYFICLLSLVVITACSTEKATPGKSGGNKMGDSPNKPDAYIGVPSDFSGIWEGVGQISEKRVDKLQYFFLINLKQTLNNNGIPTDLEINIEAKDEHKDIVFVYRITGLIIKALEVKKDEFIYQIFQNGVNAPVGKIGANGFTLSHQGNSRLFNFTVNEKVNMSFGGEKIYSNNKTIYFSSNLKKKYFTNFDF